MGKKSKFCRDNALENKFIFEKYTFCDYWTNIVAQSWFCARIYPRALTLGCWPLNFRIEILKYTFSLVCVKKILPNQTNGSKDNWGRTRHRQTTDRQQTDIFELTPIHMGNFNFLFFFYILEGENQWGEIYTSLLATQVRFAHLLRSQGDNLN